MDNENAILAYYQAIQNGSITVGKWIRMLYTQIIEGLESKRWYYDGRKANNAVRFIEKYCRHNKGPMAPQHITLSLWERATLSLIFGIVDSEGKRQFTEVVIVVGRKMGKTLLAAGITTYVAYAVGEFGSEIYFLAPKLDQADLCFSAFEFNVNHEPLFKKRTKSTKTRGLYIQESNTSVKKLPFADRKSDGYNPMLFTADEIASWKGDRGMKQWEVMISGSGARKEPLGIAISSAGYENDGIYDELIKRGSAFLMGNSREEHILPILYMIDDPEKWDDISELQKSLPGLGESVSVQFILKEISTAYESLSKKAEILTKYCNIKQNASMAWMSTQTVRKSFNIGNGAEELREMYKDMPWHLRKVEEGKITPEGNRLTLDDFERCYSLLGIDLSQTTDLTAVALLIQKEGIIYYFTQFFMPAEKLEEATARDGIPYQKYVEQGFLILSGENFVDYSDCYRWVLDLYKKYKIYIQAVGIDRYCAQYLQKDLENTGLKCDTVFQGTNLTGIIMTTEGMMKDGKLQCANDNNLQKIHWLDAAISVIGARNLRRLDKIKKTAHVDGVAAILDAMCMRANVWDMYGRRLENPERTG